LTSVSSINRPTWTGGGYGGGGAFARALRDPRVIEAAKAANVDLRNPQIAGTIFERARVLLSASGNTQAEAITALPVPLTARRPETIQNHYVRNAIRSYETIAALI
jgi:hypothetical protein